MNLSLFGVGMPLNEVIVVQEPLSKATMEPVFCEHYEALRLELEALYGDGFGSAEPKLTMNDVASVVIHCLV